MRRTVGCVTMLPDAGRIINEAFLLLCLQTVLSLESVRLDLVSYAAVCLIIQFKYIKLTTHFYAQNFIVKLLGWYYR